ncbi:hypothetical protein ACM9HF_04525 [Colwellia sp. RE-S-Sl-9]
MVNSAKKVVFLFFILFTPLCQAADSLVDTFITKTGFLIDCKKTINGDWHNYSCPHESGLDTLIQMGEADISYSENLNFQTLIDSDARYIHKNFVVNDWEVFLSKNSDNGYSLISICNPFNCLRILGEYKNLFQKIINQLKKTHNKSLKQDK